MTDNTLNQTLPLLKWPGGKRRVLPELQKYIPKTYNKYYEPFVGGGALFFNLQPSAAVISDFNGELVNFYAQVKDNHELLIEELQKTKYENSLENFLDIRKLDRDADVFAGLTKVERAARMLFLNRTCFNGLYRVNSKNQFNVPFGKYPKPRIIDKDNLENVSKLFNQNDVSIVEGSYLAVTSEIKDGGNFVYMDPPYIPLTATSSFASYTMDGFGSDEQILLMEEAKRLDGLGNFVLLSNSDTPATRELYKDFHIKSISVNRSVGASASTRVGVGEVIILGNTLAQHLAS
jgi:DNA adenine methylase